jgi:membrane-bound lytic murein transglycosylase D
LYQHRGRSHARKPRGKSVARNKGFIMRFDIKTPPLFFILIFLCQTTFSQKFNTTPIAPENLNSDTIRNRIDRLNKKTPLDIFLSSDVEKLIKKYLKNRTDFYAKNKDKINLYFPMFEEQLQNRKIPLELKYLPIIESRLDPEAVSRVGATGLWQLMFYTGLENGLKLNSYIDERMDPLKSTIAATKYLEKLYKIHPDWNLALASYNAGPRTISKAIKRSGGYKNYWNLRPFLPRETANYIPSFIATMYILEYAEEHGINIKQLPNTKPKIDTIYVKNQISFEHISSFLNISKEMIKKYNPSYIHEIIPGKNKNYITLPEKVVDSMISNEERLYAYSKSEFDKQEKPLPDLYSIDSKIIYKIKYGEFLGKIAKKFGVKVSDLKRWNNLKSDAIKENQKLIIFPKRIPKN